MAVYHHKRLAALMKWEATEVKKIADELKYKDKKQK